MVNFKHILLQLETCLEPCSEPCSGGRQHLQYVRQRFVYANQKHSSFFFLWSFIGGNPNNYRKIDYFYCTFLVYLLFLCATRPTQGNFYWLPLLLSNFILFIYLLYYHLIKSRVECSAHFLKYFFTLNKIE